MIHSERFGVDSRDSSKFNLNFPEISPRRIFSCKLRFFSVAAFSHLQISALAGDKLNR